MDGTTEIMAGLPIFASLEPRSLQAVAALARVVHANAHTVLMLEGETAESFFVIVSGTVHVTHDGRLVRSMNAGGFLGEVGLLDAGERTATATCATDCELIELGRFEFGRVLATFPDVRARIEAAAARRPHVAER